MTLELETVHQWIQGASGGGGATDKARVLCKAQGWGSLKDNEAIAGSPLCLNGRVYERGLGTHAYSEILVKLPAAGARFHAFVGVDDNHLTRGTSPGARIVFSVEIDGAAVWTSPPLTCADPANEVDVDLGGHCQFVLKAREVDDRLALAHADWVELEVTLTDGTRLFPGKSSGDRDIPDGPPISFRYNGQSSRDFLERWEKTCEVQKSAEVTLHRSRYRDPDTGLVCLVEMKEYADFPAAEWVVRFKNTGSADSPILEDVQALDMAWESFAKEIVLHRSLGSDGQYNDFFYTQDVLYKNESFSKHQSLRLTPGGVGRSSTECLPFFNLQTGSEGVIAAIGWSGEWAAEFLCDAGDNVRVRAGMEKTHLKLLPGEEIRTPSILLVFWQGEAIDGSNLLRRFLLKYKTPQVDGKPAVGPICNATWGGMKTEAHLALIKACQDRGLDFDCYWVDAGWYGVDETECPDVFTGDWGRQAGNWRVNRFRHPDGLRPIADAAHAAGMKFLLWFELERAMPETQVPTAHPDWYFGTAAKADTLLLNLGHPEALQWAIETISGYVTEIGLDWYRQDFNMDPLTLWRDADAPDRQGISEIRHIEGLYAFWDELRRRHPDLMIDNCASGGRRLDIETISRSISLWPSDYQCFAGVNPACGQIHFQGLSYWMPSHAGQTLPNSVDDTYAYRSAMGSCLANQQFIYERDAPGADYSANWHRNRLKEQKRLRPYMYGDFHPLTPISLSLESWMAYSMHRPDLDEGFLMALRREQSPFREAIFSIRGLNPSVDYLLEDADSSETWTVRGSDLMEKGLPIVIDKVRDSRLIFYRTVS